MADVALQTFEFVGRELNAALGEARTALENYVEQPDNLSLLERCKQELHQVQGVLRVLEIYGASLLAEEMEHVAGYLITTAAERKNQAESLDALMRAMVQLPSYLDRVLAGGRDLALVLLPLLNDLRAVRGSALLSEGTLLLLNLKSDKQAQPQPSAPAPGEAPLTVEQWARRLRAKFQVGLIGWIRGERLEQNLDTLISVAQKLEQIATRQPVFQLWWVVGAVLEALRENGLEEGVSVKRLLGLADREIKRLYDEGEARYAQTPAVELLNNLLYYVGRAESSGPRVTAVRTSFKLGELLPVDETIEQERENLSAPSVKLMQTVAAAIREDLGKVKDVLDIFVRRGAGQPQELASQVEMLRKIGDTLGVLGLGELRASVQAETERLGKIASGELEPDEATLVDIAATLIGVEDRLDDRLVGMILPRAAQAAPDEDTEFQLVQGAVLRECILNLARVKEAISQNVGGLLDVAGLDSWQELMRGIEAGLMMLGKSRSKEVVEAITRQLKRVMRPGGSALPPGFLDRLADAIVSVEYYMETLQSGRSDPWYMLDNAEACLQTLESEPAPAVPTVEPAADAPYEATLRIASPFAAQPAAPPEGAATAATLAPTLAAPPAPSPVVEKADPELVQLFIEEAHEELAKIVKQFPVWEQNPLEQDVLVTLRRSFHTLKGSGRMVGARELSEFAWASENLLNRLLDNTLTRSPAIVAVLREAVAALPELIEQLERGKAPQLDIAGIVSRAHGLASTRPVSAAAAVAAPSLSAPVSAAEAPARPEPPVPEPQPDGQEIDFELPAPIEESFLAPQSFEFRPEPPAAAEPARRAEPQVEGAAPAAADASAAPQAARDEVLQEIYARETSSHAAVVRAYIERERRHAEPHLLTEEIYRACHTLSGSSKMAEARHGIRLAEPLDHWLRKAFNSGVGLRGADLGLVADCMDAMESVASHLDETTGYFIAHDTLRQRLAEAESHLDQRIAEEALRRAEAERAEAERGAAAAREQHAAPPAGEEPESAVDATGIEVVELDVVAELDVAGAHVAEADTGQLPILPSHAAPPDYDPEVAAIFVDEALELLDASQAALADWRSEPGNGELRGALKRPLHTLKGGARMAGITSMGDLSHELETLVVQIDSGALPADEAAFELMQASLDELARLREAVAAGRAAPLARAVIARIHNLVRPGSASVEAPSPSPAAPVAEPRSVQPEEEPVTQPAIAVSPPSPSRDEDVDAPTVLQPALRLPMLPSEPPVAATVRAAALLAPMSAAPADGITAPLPVPPGREPVAQGDRPEMARVDAELLDQLLNAAGEVSIARARLEQQLGSIDFNLGELTRTVTRLKEQLRNLEIETEAQILHRHEDEAGTHRSEFDPLELDRYSSIQQFSRALAETANDVASIQQLLETLTQDTQNLLLQQARTITELQNGLMRTRMVPFQRHVQRLARIVRQAAADSGKRAELTVQGASGELDRQVLERMLPPFEHMLRNAVVHGIEKPDERVARGKPDAGRITLELHREGAEVMVRLVDDGGGMNLRAIRDKAAAIGLVQPGQQLSDEDAMQLVLEPGFSTAGSITQQAGRGVGMDVVATEIKRLGGALHMETKAGQGTSFTIRLPFTLAISHALVVRTGEEFYALPLPTVEGVLRLSKSEVMSHLGRESATFDYSGQKYRFQPLASFVGLEPSPLPEQDVTIPVVLVRAGEHSTGLIADELVGSREIVVKSVGPHISSIRGISGATILGDGRIVVILDIGALVRAEWRGRSQPAISRERSDRRTFALVVDDSITVRRVTQRLLERNGMRVLTARDGMDAVTLLQDHVPDIILLDIEMPRMDGYEVAAHVRNDPRLKHVPIIMITSRAGEKHRARAIELGVDDYLGKPYQEAQLLDAITPLVERQRPPAHGGRAPHDAERG
jgi:chemosensory pili system protein ChpA (sensor histidine kinase/response regulator)